jgi:hypothetical protein
VSTDADRTRLEAPAWIFHSSGCFQLDLSWDASSRRWLEAQPDGGMHAWRLVLREADDDSSDAAHEVVETGIEDIIAALAKVEGNPWLFDRSPIPQEAP